VDHRPADRADPADGLERHARALADGVGAALEGWVCRGVERIMLAWAGTVGPEVSAAAREAGRRAGAEVGADVRRLLALDIDDQRTTPLALVRHAVRYPTEVLQAAGVPGVERDRFAEAAFPNDVYGLSPASFADIDPALADVALSWGAAKAFEHKRRHRLPG
jgi:hypothetical protein